MSEQIPEATLRRKNLYKELGLPELRRTLVELSKLLVQVWLNEPAGQQFKTDIMTCGLETALENQNIFLNTEWFTAELDPDTFLGSIQMSEAGMWNKPGNQSGLEMILKIPYAPWPTAAVTEEELRNWINTCNTWLHKHEYEHPDKPFPAPPSPYIPLGTTS